MHHILSVRQFDREQIDDILVRSTEMSRIAPLGADHRLSGRRLATIFFEPSTRTRLSFESAMYRLGGQVISSEMALETSSASKGETIEDTVRIVESYADIIVMRHPQAGILDRAAAVASAPVINAGDGAREHPTQALLDLFTLHQELGRIDGLTIALVGDLRYGRAPRSLVTLLARTQNCKLLLISPPALRMHADVLKLLDAEGLDYEISDDLDAAASVADAVYMTRVQKERFSDDSEYQAVRGAYQFGFEQLDRMQDHAVLMHPLPRVDEIAPAVDQDPRAAYFRQAQNGVYVRMALLDMILNRRTFVA